MFDFGFSEILLVFVLALIVLGPERLPGVVRRVGRWVGRARAMARQFQDQLEEEIDLDGSRRPAPVESSAPHSAESTGATESAEAAEPADPDDRAQAAQQAEPAEVSEQHIHPDVAANVSGDSDSATDSSEDAPARHEPRV